MQAHFSPLSPDFPGAGASILHPVRFIMGVSGASAMPLAVKLLQALADLDKENIMPIETHLVVSQDARKVLAEEGPVSLAEMENMAHTVYAPEDLAAPPASGSWPCTGMVVCPCSMSSLANIAHGTGRNLLHRAADVTLKERRPLVLAVRETPLSAIHLENMLKLSQAGATIFPPLPAFYARPETMDEMLGHLAGRILDALIPPWLVAMGLQHSLAFRWGNHNGQTA